MVTEKLDSTDIKILRAMQENARLTTKELAAKVNLSSTPVFERLKRLERDGFIRRYAAVLNAEKLNRGFMVFCCVKFVKMTTPIAMEFNEFVRRLPEVTECYTISGNFDAMLKVHAADMKSYKEFLLNELGSLASVASIESIFVMDEVKANSGLNI